MAATSKFRRSLVSAALAAVVVPMVRGDEAPDSPFPTPSGKPVHYVAPASDEGTRAIRQMAAPSGWKIDLFAAEPDLANPVCFSIDDRGRVYVVETFRRRNAVLDIRKLPTWLDDDLALRTVEQRIAMVKRRLPNDWQRLVGITDRVRLVEDTNGDGKADKATVFADKFDQLEDGTAAGVLPVGDDVYFANIPSLWKLKDTNNDGVADERASLHYGFGVRYAYSGHDFHGLKMGPDGRLYFSIADRGVHIVDKATGKVLIDNPDSGCVMRCEPDGSNLEVVHTGMRNPQELAFDELGNLFTGDNNSDGGDPTRWVHVVDGGDSGWHVGWQWLTHPVSRGPWMAEDLCQVNSKLPAYYRLPPVATPKIAGPAGLTYTPGTGLPDEWAGRFLLVDFRGTPAGGSGVYALKNKPKGASFELEEMKELVTNVLATDVDFGPDGRIYFADWINGWEPHGKGRLYTLTPPGHDTNAAVAEVKKLLAEPFAGVAEDALAGHLSHADMRVRQKAQFELARRGEKGTAALSAVATNTAAPLLARVHAMWGLGQLARTKAAPTAVATLAGLLRDGDAEVRAQAARSLVDGHAADAADPDVLARMASIDRSPRVRYFATLALGSAGRAAHFEAVLTMLRKNNDNDAYLRHAGVMALTAFEPAKVQPLEKAAADTSAAVRVAALLAYRRLSSPAVARFLDDVDPNLVLEAARAINDLTIDPAMPRLAGLVAKPGLLEPTMYRALNANYRLGTAESAKNLVAVAGRSDVPMWLRVEAMKMLAAWPKPSGRDRVTGLWRPIATRSGSLAAAALAPALDGLLTTAPDAVRVAALNAAISLGVNTTPLIDLVRDTKNPAGLRAAAVAAMAERKDKQLPAAAELAMNADEPALRLAGIRTLPAVPNGMTALGMVMTNGTPRERQAVVQTAAATIDSKDKAVAKDAETILRGAYEMLEKGTLPAEAQLDLLTAAAKKKTGKLADSHKAYEAKRAAAAAADPLATWRETLAGGDADRGAYIFKERADVSCMRCHAIKGVGGNAGPDLSGLLARSGPAGREHILESIVYPPKKIAPGWETVSIETRDGDTIAGVLKSETADAVSLDVPNQGEVIVAKSKIEKRRGGMSGMPEDIVKTLTKQDVRDLVEFLAGQ